MKKRILSLLLCGALMFSLCFQSALATGHGQAETECICTSLCTTETIEEDCPVCGAENADFALCEGEAETAVLSNAEAVYRVAGDAALCDFAKTLIPAITTVPVNVGRGGGVTSLHPDEAVERIEAAAKEAAAKAAQCVVPMPEHFHMEIDFVKHHVAYSKSFYPGATLKDDKFVCFDSDDWFEMLRFCHFVLSDA